MSWWCCPILSTIYRLHSQSNPWAKHIKWSRSVFPRHSLNRHGFKTIVCIFSMSWLVGERLTIHLVIWLPPILRPENRVWVFFKIKTTLLLKKLQEQCYFGWRNLILPWPLREHSALVIPNSRLPYPYRLRPDYQYRSQNAFTSATGAKRLRGSFSLILPKVCCLFPFLESLSIILKVFL